MAINLEFVHNKCVKRTNVISYLLILTAVLTGIRAYLKTKNDRIFC